MGDTNTDPFLETPEQREAYEKQQLKEMYEEEVKRNRKILREIANSSLGIDDKETELRKVNDRLQITMEATLHNISYITALDAEIKAIRDALKDNAYDIGKLSAELGKTNIEINKMKTVLVTLWEKTHWKEAWDLIEEFKHELEEIERGE